MESAKILLETIATILQRPARNAISIQSNFFEIGGDSLNSIYTITKLNEQGYHISISDFLTAKTLGDILDKMNQNQNLESSENIPKYEMEMLKDEHQAAVIE